VPDLETKTVTISIGTPLREAEKTIIEATLRSTGGNISLAAKILGIDRSTLYSKIGKHKLPR
jgi:transcriptional regulator of acetoin/glycerol metabolism